MKGIYQTGIQDEVWVVQQWLGHTGETENLEVVQSLRLDDSAVQSGTECLEDSSLHGNPKLLLRSVKKGYSHRVDGPPSKTEGEQAKIKVFFLCLALSGLPPEVSQIPVWLFWLQII